MRNVHVGCGDEGENAGVSGTQGQPAEFCQEKHGAEFLARAIGVRDEGGGKRERGKKVCVCECVEVWRQRGRRRFAGALSRANTKRRKKHDKA